MSPVYVFAGATVAFGIGWFVGAVLGYQNGRSDQLRENESALADAGDAMFKAGWTLGEREAEIARLQTLLADELRQDAA